MIDDRDIEIDWDDSVIPDDDYLDDPNLYLPNYFITCFSSWDLPVYQEAVKRFTAERPDCGLELDLSGCWNPHKDGALLCFSRDQLTAFWELFEVVKKELAAQPEAVALA